MLWRIHRSQVQSLNNDHGGALEEKVLDTNYVVDTEKDF